MKWWVNLWMIDFIGIWILDFIIHMMAPHFPGTYIKYTMFTIDALVYATFLTFLVAMMKGPYWGTKA